ncbi:MAG: BlaI/MecI/CopY family transcriptional regulator [Armatimonadetes bacterium]|nr:BlaI/MecI/CopY family transcriptional regulator [Armatimonadota bacterium]
MLAKQRYLPPREQQILDLLQQHKELSAKQIVDLLPDKLSNSSIRTFLRSLEAKGRITHIEAESQYIYRPIQAPFLAAKDELKRLVSVYFEGSISATVSAMIDERDAALSDQELDEIQAMIDAARKGGRS